ncbi:MAG: protein kinase [Candidatus Moeniiplasma glomeromycotorum]|nr:protein kinase [Candidatus Moeniiplasma glomeromycotorum]MCE8162396.1 protein kinase [Candidatus Moeniiplasma glomeromycotorum]MCE8166322.1 protein kinase [Candidatus Moeniiplasma glomeromycotorum]MCE8166804.1 protein kinase [Candidatus Moeniiplasma glomeromycotorum]
MVNAQEWLKSQEKYNTREKREKVIGLKIVNKELERELDLRDFINLEYLDCSHNRLTKLNIKSCLKLKNLNCGFNKLTNLDLTNLNLLEVFSCSDNYLNHLDYSSLNPNKLFWLNITDNNLSEQDLSVFSEFIKLKSLWIGGNSKERFNQNIYNKFYGSLGSLQNLSELESLYISNTDIDNGDLEYLPNSIKEIYCYANERPKSKVKEVEKKLQVKDSFYKFSADDNCENISYRRIWKDIHKDFTPDLQREWENKRFSYKEVKKWVNCLGIYFHPQRVDFFLWLRDEKFIFPETILYCNNYEGTDNDEKIVYKMHDLIMEYTDDSPTKKTQLRQLELKLPPKQEELGDVSSEWWYDKHILCPNCKQATNSAQVTSSSRDDYFYLCRSCDLKNLNSGNEEIDRIIKSVGPDETLNAVEWIPYEQFTEVEYLAQGGFSEVYKAKWNDGQFRYWGVEDDKTESWRDNYRWVVLKVLNNSQDMEKEAFIHEIKSSVLFNKSQLITKCYGLSRDPKTKNYIMVMEYIPNGNLRKYLSDNGSELCFMDKMKQLCNIAYGLNLIHEQGLIHRDFHSGNILKHIESSYISDLGLCKPVNEVSQEKEIYGVLPYIAPEVLRNKGYTLASDIYSLGIVAYEIFANQSPYLNREWDISLSVEICKGLRPNLNELKIPQDLKNLIQQCWDAEPLKRPTANKLEKTLRNWQKDTKFIYQLQEIEAEYNQISQNSTYKSHPTAIMVSKRIDTKQITKSLSEKIIVKNSQEQIFLESEEIPPIEIEQEQFQSHQEIPPKK